MALLTAANITRAGIRVDAGGSAAADAGGDEFVNTGKQYLLVHNGSGGSINVTLDIQKTVDGAAVTDPVVAVAAGQSRLIGPFPPNVYNDGDGRVNVAYSAVTTVTVRVVQIA